jgi:dTDP-glucose pyrophosphorylase
VSNNFIFSNATLIDAISTIEKTSKRLAVVLSDDYHVIGTLTDGDIRRHILQGSQLEASVSNVMNNNPITASINSSDSLLRKLLSKNNIRSIPLVDDKKKYVRTIELLELDFQDGFSLEKTFSAAIIMAGGEGTRLMPLTKMLPKPMIDINGLPLLERQIRQLCNIGIKLVYISVNYLNEVIQDYFGDGSRFGIEIKYLHEKKKLGTAGALSLLPNDADLKSLLLMNGDILTTSDFINLLHFHEDQKSVVTICAVDYNIQIPYGVIEYNGTKVEAIKEKPSQHFFCNAGIYALSESILKKIPSDKFFNMTDLIEKCLVDSDSVSVFPVYEYWSDIGTEADLTKARNDFKGRGLE